MSGDLALLKLASAMTRYAGAKHSAIGSNIARADIPHAKAIEGPRFAEAFSEMMSGKPIRFSESRGTIRLEDEVVAMAENAGRHRAAVTIWSKTLDLLRVAGQAPR
ncbi:MAG: hypothetical protein ACWA5T_06195 [Parvularcula sp.]